VSDMTTNDIVNTDFDFLKRDFIELKRLHGTFQALLDEVDKKKPQSEDILTLSAPLFFKDVLNCYYELIILRCARLLDPARQGRNTNITFNTLLDHVRVCSQTDFLEMNGVLEKMKSLEVIKSSRNKGIAHLDYDSNVGLGSLLYPSVDEISLFMAFGECFIRFFERFTGSEVWNYEVVVERPELILFEKLNFAQLYIEEHLND